MNRTDVIGRFDRDWNRWTSTLESIDPDTTRTPGVCGSWTLHDVVGHVQAQARFRLVNVRGAFSGIAPTREEINGDRIDWADGEGGMDTDSLNESIRVRGLDLSWQQLLDESELLRASTLDFIDRRTDEELADDVGWVHFWAPTFAADPNNIEGLMIRRVRDMPAARNPVSTGLFVQPNEPDQHLDEHLGQIMSWLDARR